MANSTVRGTLVEVANLLADLFENQNVDITPPTKRHNAARAVPAPRGPVSELDKEKARQLLRNKGIKTS